MIPTLTISSQAWPGNVNGQMDNMAMRTCVSLLLSLFGYNSGPDQWIHLYDATVYPGDGSVPYHTFKIAGGDNFSLIVPVTGINFSTGVVAVVSSTSNTTTKAGHTVAMVATFGPVGV